MATDKLTDNQRAVLLAAARSANLVAWPVPPNLKLSRGSATLVAKRLLKRGLLEERPVLGNDATWRDGQDGKALTLVISKAGMAAVGMAPTELSQAEGLAVPMGQRRMPRAGSKLGILAELLAREKGATIQELADATGWQTHSVRGVLSSMAKKFGLEITSTKIEGRGRQYRVR